MKVIIKYLLVWFWMCFLTSCTPNQNFLPDQNGQVGQIAVSNKGVTQGLFVLLPDQNGQVGQIAVSNKGVTQVLKEARQAVNVKTRDKAPEPPYFMEEKQIKALFGEALTAQPDPPLRFLLYFKKGTSDLNEESEKLIPEFLDSIKARNSTDISIIGHTDRVGTREYNFRLASDRANVIKFLLIYQGINSDLIEVASHGEDDPLIKTEDGVPEPRNRRVEVVIR